LFSGGAEEIVTSALANKLRVHPHTILKAIRDGRIGEFIKRRTENRKSWNNSE